MKTNIHNNKYALLNIKQKYNWFIMFSVLLLIIIIYFACYFKTYDSFKYIGICDNKNINITVLSSDVSNILESSFLKVNNKKYKFSILSISETGFDTLTNNYYQTVSITTHKNYLDNESLNITFYKNKQRIITKIFNLLK